MRSLEVKLAHARFSGSNLSFGSRLKVVHQSLTLQMPALLNPLMSPIIVPSTRTLQIEKYFFFSPIYKAILVYIMTFKVLKFRLECTAMHYLRYLSCDCYY